MTMFAGLDAGSKRTVGCVIDAAGRRLGGMVDPHPEMIDAALKRFAGERSKVGPL